MITLLKKLFIQNWQRKLISLILAMIIWMIVSHSMTSTRTVHNIPVKIIHMPPGKTIEGLQSNGQLNKRISLMLSGNKNVIDNLSGNDIEIVIDAAGKRDEWITSLTKKNLISLNPNIDITRSISFVHQHDFILKLSKLITEKIPVLVTQPIGETPKGYQYLDVWPYQLYMTITGPEERVKKIKARGIKLTFNLNDISRDQLNSLKKLNEDSDEISFFVPESWKKISMPIFSELPYDIDDPLASSLRIDFVKRNLLPIDNPIPITIFFSTKHSDTLNPETYQLKLDDFIKKQNGIPMITYPLYAKGISRLFLDVVKEMIQVVIVISPKSEKEKLLWNAQFIYPHDLENRYVSKVLAEMDDEKLRELKPVMREEYIRNRFRSFMNRFRLFTPEDKKLKLSIELEAQSVKVSPINIQSNKINTEDAK